MYCYLGLGSNLGEKQKYIKKAIEQISNLEFVEIIRTSSIIETKPYGKIDQPDFLNCVVELQTELTPENLLKKCLDIENRLGRVRKEKWGPRTIDIDLLLYENVVMNTKTLILPHPELHKRKFVLESLNELCPNLMHPIIKKNIKEIYLESK